MPASSRHRSAHRALTSSKSGRFWEEVSRKNVYVDTKGRRWVYRQRSLQSGWQVGSSRKLYVWPTAVRTYWAGFPLRVVRTAKEGKPAAQQPVILRRRRGLSGSTSPPSRSAPATLPQPTSRKPPEPPSRTGVPELEDVAEELRQALRGPF